MLSVLLPVHNAQSTLAGTISSLLEVLPELDTPLELLVLDDGSQDATAELVHDLRASVPQLRLLRHATRRGTSATIREGIADAKGDSLLLIDEACRLELRDLHKLWRQAGDFDAVFARPKLEQGESGSWAQRLRAWNLRMAGDSAGSFGIPGYQLVQGPAREAIRRSVPNQREMLLELTRRGYRWQEVEVRVAATPGSQTSGRGTSTRPAAFASRSNLSLPKQSSPRAPKFLGKVKAFAVGE